MDIVEGQRLPGRYAIHMRQRTRGDRGLHQRLAIGRIHLEHEVIVAEQRIAQRLAVLRHGGQRRQLGQDAANLVNLSDQLNVIAARHLPLQRGVQISTYREKGRHRHRRQQQRHAQRQ